MKQGDPMTPFLLLLVDEGLGGVFSRVVDHYIFSSSRVGSSYSMVYHLQYDYGMLILADAY